LLFEYAQQVLLENHNSLVSALEIRWRTMKISFAFGVTAASLAAEYGRHATSGHASKAIH